MSKDQQASSQLNLKSIQPQEKQKVKSRPRPPTDPTDQDKVKKKRKLLSFGQQLDQGSPDKKEKIKRADITQKNKKKLQFNKQGGKNNIEEQLKAEFQQKIEALRQQMFQIDYSYWDGPQVVKKLKRKKKQTIGSLIQVCKLQLIANFQNLALIPVQDLLLIIKDFIIPHKMTIADIQALQMKTTKGDLLLNFKNVQIKDLKLSVNMQGPFRIIERAKYQKNITAYPFNTWQKMNID